MQKCLLYNPRRKREMPKLMSDWNWSYNILACHPMNKEVQAEGGAWRPVINQIQEASAYVDDCTPSSIANTDIIQTANHVTESYCCS